MIPFENGFSVEAIRRSQTSKYKIILTNERNLCSDIKSLRRGCEELNLIIILLFVIVFLLIIMVSLNLFYIYLLLIK